MLYDKLVGPEIVDYARRDAERIYVGKAKADHTKTQDEINALMAEHALAGRRVVRLKGGDPFIFGRGGEEMGYLRARGVAVEVVPGVTAAAGCAAAAGIPAGADPAMRAPGSRAGGSGCRALSKPPTRRGDTSRSSARAAAKSDPATGCRALAKALAR